MPGKSYKTDEASIGVCLEDDLLYRYLVKLATEDERQRVEQHLNLCENCFEDFAFLARNAYAPASEAEKAEVARLRTLTAPEQVARILGYVKTQESVEAKLEEGPKTFFQTMGAFVSERALALLGRRVPAPQFVFATVMLLVGAVGSFWTMQYYKKGYRVGKAERLVRENYQVSIADQEPRLSGDYAPTGLGTLMGPAEKERPYLNEALTLTEEAIANGYKSPKARQLLAQIYVIQGNFTQADSVLQRVLKESPALAATLNDLGVIYFRQKEVQTAAQYFAAAIQADPQSKEARYNLALAKIEMGEKAQAMSILQEYIDRENVDGWKNAALKLKRELE
jgi:tetratricopeptide (TPR) repeat protein